MSAFVAIQYIAFLVILRDSKRILHESLGPIKGIYNDIHEESSQESLFIGEFFS